MRRSGRGGGRGSCFGLRGSGGLVSLRIRWFCLLRRRGVCLRSRVCRGSRRGRGCIYSRITWKYPGWVNLVVPGINTVQKQKRIVAKGSGGLLYLNETNELFPEYFEEFD